MNAEEYLELMRGKLQAAADEFTRILNEAKSPSYPQPHAKSKRWVIINGVLNDYNKAHQGYMGIINNKQEDEVEEKPFEPTGAMKFQKWRIEQGLLRSTRPNQALPEKESN